MILVLDGDDPPDIPHIISQFKGAVSKEVRKMYPGIQLWQRSYYDHVIRNQEDYVALAEYIQTNPVRRELDKLYTEE